MQCSVRQFVEFAAGELDTTLRFESHGEGGIGPQSFAALADVLAQATVKDGSAVFVEWYSRHRAS